MMNCHSYGSIMRLLVCVLLSLLLGFLFVCSFVVFFFLFLGGGSSLPVPEKAPLPSPLLPAPPSPVIHPLPPKKKDAQWPNFRWPQATWRQRNSCQKVDNCRKWPTCSCSKPGNVGNALHVDSCQKPQLSETLIKQGGKVTAFLV